MYGDPPALTIFFCVCFESALLISVTFMFFFRYWCKEMNAAFSPHMGNGLDWTISALWNYSSRFLTFSLLRVVDQDFSLGVVGCNLPAWLQWTASALDCRLVLYNNAGKSHTPHQSSLSGKISWTIQRSKNDEGWWLLVSSSKEKNFKNPEFGQCHAAFSSWF